MRQDVCATAAALAALALVLVVPASRACPRSCNCYQANEVHCTFRSLLAVPGGLPARTQRINLGFNSISRIPERSLAGLKRAELLMLHGNDLHRIPDGVFRDMKSLQVLKLSYNKLKEISSSRVFSGLTSLLRLHLDHNLLQHLHPQALLQLPSLRLLRLQGNRLHQLHPHSLCTLSFLNTYHYSTLRHLDLSNNSLTTLSREVLETAPLMETLVLQANPWSCDCRMSWLLGWSVAHPGLMKCPEGPQCPVCSSPSFLQGRGLLQQTDLSCTSPIISSPGRDLPSGSDLGETPPAEAFREPLGAASLGLSDQQGNSVELSCSISHSTDYPDITPPPDFSSSSSAPLPLALSISLSLDCPVESRGYESLWRILAYYSEIAVRLEREIMLSTAPALTYRYRQAGETEGYYHTGVTASVKVKPNWLLQPAISIQLNRPHSTRHQVQLILSTRVSARPDSISHTESFSSLTSNSSLHPWVRISTYHTATAVAAVTGSRIELSCPVISSGNHTIQWILPDGSKLIPPYSSPDGRFRVTESGLLLQRTQFSDAGIYHCVARAGKDVDVLRLRLAVEESSAPPPGEQVGPVVTGFVGEPVRVPCNVSGSPTPEISWVLPDGNIVKRGLGVSDGIIIDSNGSLSLPHPSLNDIGHYRCTAVNQIGVDSLSMRLDLNPRPAPSLRTFFRSGPQSASGRSTRIRAPLLRETMLEEGSGAEEEDGEKLPIINRRGPRPNGPPINGRFPTGHPRRRGHVRGGRPRQGGLPSPTFELRRNRFDGRQRGSTTNQRIDPQKWADLLAKIRQRTTLNTTSQPTIEAEPTSQPSGREKSREAERDEGDGDSGKEKEDVTSDIKRGVEGGEERENKREGEVEVGVEAETEGSSIDDAGLEEEGLQPVIQVNMDTQTNKGIKTNTFSNTERGAGKEKDTKADKQKGKSTEISGQDRENEAVTQTQTVANTVTQTASVTSKPLSRTNEIGPERGGGQGRQPNPSPSAAGFHNHRQRVPANLLPNSRPQSPWNARRRVGQRRRIINRNRGRPLAPPQPLPDPTNPRSQTVTPDTNSNQIDTLTTSLPGMVSTRIDPIRAPSANPNRLESDLLSPTLSGVSPSSLPHYQTAPASSPSSVPLSSVILPSVSLSPSSAIPIRTDTLNRSFNTPDRVESTSSPPKTQMPVHPRTTMPHTQAIQTQGRTSSSKNTDITTSRHVEEDSKGSVSSTSHASINFSAYPPYPISSTATHSTNEETPSTTPVAITNTRSTSSTRSNPTTTATPPTTFRSPTLSTSTTTTVKTTSPNTSSTASTTTTTTTTSTAITNSQDARSYKLTTTPHTTTVSTTSATIPTTTKTTTTPTTTTTTPSTTAAASTTTSTTTPTTSPPLSEAHTTTASSSSRESSSKRPSPGRVDPRERPVPGVLNQRRTGLDWKNPAANSIPDSHSGRPLPPSSPALPASPGGSGGNPVPTHPLGSPKVPVVRSRPRIADPHIRTVSVPAESTAKLACEAQGHPTPAITWTKVSTGAVMSASLRAERFEVLPNGTFVIHNVQLQDRGTYICSAQSFLGRDRMLTTLEVWSRPPRMQSANYRETTIHQGGEIRLDCQAEGIPAPLLSWVLPDRSVITSNSSRSRVTMHANGTLHLSVTLPSDRGVYRCVASNLAGAASASVRVHISSLPPMMHQPREERLVLAPGMPLYALCSARGAPPPTLRWRTPDGTLLRPSQFLHGNLFVLPNGTLHIRKLGPKDSGRYECTAGNAVGVVKRTVRVVLKGSAEDNGWAVGRAGDLGERATGEAVSAVTQAPSATHPRKGSAPSLQLHPFNRSRTSLLSPNSPLSSPLPEPPSSPKPLHRNNTGASQRKSSPLSPSNPLSPSIPTNKTKVPLPVLNNTRVHSSSPADKIQLPPSYPSAPGSNLSKAHIISTSPSVTTIHHGGNLLLHCSVSGNPTPTVIWRTPLRKLVDMHFSFDQRLKVHHNGSLLVHTVTERDAGDYLCIARNKVSDDYRLLRVTVATKPAKIDPKQPSNKMVSFGGSLKVDCLASGLPDPAVTWSLPDGTMVNSVLRGEDQGRARRLTVFDNGTLLVPAVGMGEEGEYTCYAKNPGGQDTMKVKVHVMLTSAPAFTDGLSYQIIKVRQGATVALRCHAAGDPTPTVTWFTPNNRVIPRSSGSRYFSERVVVLSDGAMEVRLAQKGDAGNYTCRAYNTAGERSRVVGLEVEAFNNGHSGRVSNGRGSGSNGHSGAFYQHGTTNGVISKFGSNGVGSSSSTNSRVINTIPSYNMNLTNSGLKPASGADSSVGVNRPINGVLARLGNGVISVGVSGASNIAIKPGDIGLNRYRGISSSSISAGNNPVAIGEVGEGGIARNSNNEVVSGRNGNYTNSGIVNGKTSGATSNTGVISSSASSSGAGTGIARGNVLSSNTGWTNGGTHFHGRFHANGGSTSHQGVVTSVKQRAVKGQTVILHCPSHGSPLPRLSWLLPGNGILPAPYYGSRLTVHRNGSLELRGVRASDGGTLVCVVRGDRGETRIQVELTVSDAKEDPAAERPAPEGPVSVGPPHAGDPQTVRGSVGSSIPRPPLPETLQPRSTVTEKPPQRSPLLLNPQRPVGLPLRPESPASEPVSGKQQPVVSTKTGSLVSIINGENLRLSCPAPQNPGQTRGTLSWTLPRGEVLSRGESADSGKYSVLDEGTLVVQQATVFDRGSYSCRSTSHDSSAALVVTVPVIVIAYPPRITMGPSPVTYTRPGVAVELPCLTIATPRATVTWETPDLSQLRVTDQARIYGNRYLSAQGSLVIQNPSSRDTGFYRCTAKNVIGADTKATYLHVV